MTSERTPQDVLREALHSEFWSTELEHAAEGEHACIEMEEGSERRISEILAAAGYEIRAIDKAIAEAPDSPKEATVNELTEAAWGVIANAGGGDWTRETEEWQDAAARWREKYHAVLAAPDTLSEKPGLDVERLGLSDEQTAILRDHLASRQQTVAEFFGDVLMSYGLGRATGKEYPPAGSLALASQRSDGLGWSEHAEERQTPGSTDSEGR